jgi:hypothetical protein
MKAIPPFRLVAEPLNEQARKMQPFKWAPKDVGTRHRLGGMPDFIQEHEWPNCPMGHGKMSFYAQLDSINDDICIADCGMIYVFLCFECFNSATIVQSS